MAVMGSGLGLMTFVTFLPPLLQPTFLSVYCEIKSTRAEKALKKTYKISSSVYKITSVHQYIIQFRQPNKCFHSHCKACLDSNMQFTTSLKLIQCKNKECVLLRLVL